MNLFSFKLDHRKIEHAIAQAELRTSGEIRVVIHHSATLDPVATASEEFARLRMYRTRDRNAVLILVAPESRTFAVWGDEGVHDKCGKSFWTNLTAEMSTHFRNGAFTEGLLLGIARAGQLLGEHFPRHPDDRNELPDSVIERHPMI
jgi:uncharacterized membrane protein